MDTTSTSASSEQSSALHIIILGPQGSGKGTQAEVLAQKYNLFHLETGKLMRAAAQEESDLGRQVNEYINVKGELVPFDIVMEIFRREVERVPLTQGIVFDGTPRRMPEVAYWDKELPKLGRRFTHIFSLSLSEEKTMERLMLRKREDDTEETIRKRLDEYYRQTAPVLAHYKEAGELIEINGDQSIEEVFRDLEKHFQV
ncbi:MAG: nucleoside monophosphate kinase [Candidatus Nomurabacteria bacterium]|nr:MAG: nucleoside monophosphate kinase [Candidatus Nomurabacteria bacterium]